MYLCPLDTEGKLLQQRPHVSEQCGSLSHRPVLPAGNDRKARFSSAFGMTAEQQEHRKKELKEGISMRKRLLSLLMCVSLLLGLVPVALAAAPEDGLVAHYDFNEIQEGSGPGPHRQRSRRKNTRICHCGCRRQRGHGGAVLTAPPILKFRTMMPWIFLAGTSLWPSGSRWMRIRPGLATQCCRRA